MWISKKKYDELVAKQEAQTAFLNSLGKEFDDVKLELKVGGLIDGSPLSPQDYMFRTSTFKYPIVRRFIKLCDALGYEYKVTPEKEEFVKKRSKR